MSATWYESLFDDRYLSFYEGLLDLEPQVADADFVDRALALPRGARILDLGCAFGRHAVPLARLGYDVTGIDLSPFMLGVGEAMAREHKAQVTFQQRDMRDLSGLGPFDACVALYTVLGYFDDADNARVLREVASVLAPHGRLVVDLTNPLSHMPRWPGEKWRETEQGVFREVSRYDAVTGRLTTERVVFRRNGVRETLPTSVVRMWVPSEVATMLHDAGFDVDQVYGALRDEQFAWRKSDKQVWVATKR